MIGSSGKPVLILANHTSFLDSLLFAAHINYNTLARMVTLASAQLFRMPILGTIMQSVGHIAVHFKDHNGDNDFSTDASKKDQMVASIESHVTRGGWLCMYPEGQIHRGHGSQNTAMLQPFRVGGLKIALQYDMEVWAWVTKGNNDCWPRAAIGGLPTAIRAHLMPIAPTGSCDLLREIDQSLEMEHEPIKLFDSLPTFVTHIQKSMQAALDELYDDKERDA